MFCYVDVIAERGPSMSFLMSLIRRNEISFNVTLLHKALSNLGMALSQEEWDERKAGEFTQRQVDSLLKRFGVAQPSDDSLLLDQKSIAAIVTLLEENDLLRNELTFNISGNVTRKDEPVKQQKLMAFDIDVIGAGVYKEVTSLDEIAENGGFEFLASAEADAKGRYSVTFYEWFYRRAERKKADVIVYAVTGNKIVGRSTLVRVQDYSDEGFVRNINIAVTQTDNRSEYEQVMTSIEQFMEESQISLAVIASSNEQLSFVASELDMELVSVQKLAETIQFSQSEFDSNFHDLLYGLACQQVTITWEAFFEIDEEEIKAYLEAAVQKNTIVSPKSARLNAFLEAIRQGAINAVVKGTEPETDNELQTVDVSANPLLSVLQHSNLSTTQKKEYAATLHSFNGNDVSQFFTELQQQPSFGDNRELVNELAFTQQLDVAALGHGAMINELKTKQQVVSAVDLINISDSKWQSIVKKVGVPAEIEGVDEKEKRATYVQAIKTNLNNTYPNLCVAKLIKNNSIKLSTPTIANNIDVFLSTESFGENKVFSLNSSKIHDFDDELQEIAGDEYEATKTELLTLQRLQYVSVSPDNIQVLKDKDLLSSYAISSIPQKNFVAANAEALGGESIALQISNQARFKSAQSESLLLGIRDFGDLSIPGFMNPGIFFDATSEKLAEQGIDYTTLFGSANLCECEHCRSVQSPSSYFVYLLQFLRRSIVDVDGDSQNILDELTKRRPDLVHLPLTCENTHTLVPYVDLANEVMEAKIVYQDTFSEYSGYNTGSVTAEEIRAEPQNRQASAYQILSNNDSARPAIYPAALPYHLPLDSLRAYLHELALTRHELLVAVNANADDAAIKRSVTAEALQLSEADYQILAKENFAGEPDTVATARYYSQGLDVLARDIPLLLDSVAILYVELIELLKTSFLNPHRPLLGVLQRLIARKGVDAEQFYERLLNLEEEEGTQLTPGGFTVGNFYEDLLQIGSNSPASAAIRAIIEEFNEANATEVLPEEVEAWIRENLEDFNSILTLYSPDASCDLTKVRLTDMEGLYNPDIDIAIHRDNQLWDRLHRFLRLQHKIGLTIPETDILLQALKTQDIDQKALADIAAALQLADVLALSIEEVAVFWGDIPTQGPDSLYKKTFLTKASLPVDKDFEADVFGVYSFGDATWKMKFAFLAAAFSVSEKDLTIVLEAEEIDVADKINLQSLRLVFCYTSAARALELTISELIIAIRLFDGFPFARFADELHPRRVSRDPAQTLAFFVFVQELQASDLSVAQWSYVLEGFSGEVGASTAEKKSGITAKRVESSLRAVAALVPTQTSQSGIEPVGRNKGTQDIVMGEVAALLSANPTMLETLAPNVAVALQATIEVLHTTIDDVDREEPLQLPSALVADFQQLVFSYERALLCIEEFSLEVGEVSHFLANSEDFADLTFVTLSGEHYKRLQNYVQLRRYSVSDVGINLLDLFTIANDADSTLDEAITAFSLLFELSSSDTSELFAHFSLGISDLTNEAALLPVAVLAKHMVTLGVTAETVLQLGDAAADYAALETQATVVKQAVKAHHDRDAWLHVAGKVSDTLRENQQRALVAYLLQQNDIQNAGVRDADALFEHLLIDVQMTSCMETSRIVQASAAIQMYVNRVLLNLEEGLSPDAIDKGHWQWIKNYRVWEANRKIFLYPENWLEPEWRTNKSEFFKDLESYLTQNDVTDRNTESALRNYVMSVDAVSQLEVCGLYKEKLLSGTGVEQGHILHVFGRTSSAPYTFYYRTLNQFKKWSAWEKISAGITSVEAGEDSGVHLVPVVWKNRLLLFWPEFVKKQRQSDVLKTGAESTESMANRPMNSLKAEEYWEVRLAWSEYVDGAWTAKQLTSSVGELPGHRVPQFTTRHSFAGKSLTVTISSHTPSPGSRMFRNNVTFYFSTVYSTNAGQERRYGTVIANNFNDRLFDDVLEEVTPYLDGDTSKVEILATSDQNLGRRVRRYEFTEPFFFKSKTESYFVDQKQAVQYLYLTFGRFSWWIRNPLAQEHLKSFHTFHHPKSSDYVERLNQNGVAELLRSDLTLPDDQGDGFTAAYGPRFDSGLVTPRPAELGDGKQYSDRTFYKNNVCFDSHGANSLYNWELFFHAPLYIATRLSKSGKYEEAMKWFHYIFDPTSDEKSDGENELSRVWQVLPFRKETPVQLEEWFRRNVKPGEENPDIAEWIENPFDPHLVANNRPLAYMKHVFIKYVENLIAWGDAKFKQFTRENVYEALQLYTIASQILGPKPQVVPSRGRIGVETFDSLQDKLDSFGNALVALENIAPSSGPTASSTSGAGNNLLGVGEAFYFCIPANDKLRTYWDTIEDRLLKIRHCQDIDGVERRLALFAPPIDPALLVDAQAQGVDIDTVLSELGGAPSAYRFGYLLAKANELCDDVKSLGVSILAATEKQDGEALSLLRSSQEITLQESVTTIREKQVLDSKVAVDSLRKSRETMVLRLQTYAKRLGIDELTIPAVPDVAETVPEDTALNPIESAAENQAVLTGDSGVKMIHQEKRQIELAQDALDNIVKSNIAEQYSGYMGMIPQFDVKAQPLGVGAGTGFGGRQLSWLAGAVAKGFTLESQVKSADASKAATIASYIRREQEWALQAQSAIKEIVQIDKQIAGAAIRQQVAEKQLENHKKQIENAKEVEQFLRNKFSGHELYTWMREQLLFVYKQSYDLCYEMIAKVESAYTYELGTKPSLLQSSGYWDNNKMGLLAGEKLQLVLRQLESRYMEENTRRLELNKNISLRSLRPDALLELRETGTCTFSLPEGLFDLDYQGHTFRRIKSVSVSLPCVAGPYTTVNATLTLLNNTVPEFASGFEPTTKAIATSSGLNDAGMFEFNFRDERYLPFEGAGVVSEWELSLTEETALRQFDYETISDCIMHCHFTARDGGDKAVAVERANEHIAQSSILLDMKRDYGTQWHRFVTPAVSEEERALSLRLEAVAFPYVAQNQSITIESLAVYTKNVDAGSKIILSKSELDGDVELGESALVDSFGDLRLAEFGGTGFEYSLGEELHLRLASSTDSPLSEGEYALLKNMYVTVSYSLT